MVIARNRSQSKACRSHQVLRGVHVLQEEIIKSFSTSANRRDSQVGHESRATGKRSANKESKNGLLGPSHHGLRDGLPGNVCSQDLLNLHLLCCTSQCRGPSARESIGTVFGARANDTRAPAASCCSNRQHALCQLQLCKMQGSGKNRTVFILLVVFNCMWMGKKNRHKLPAEPGTLGSTTSWPLTARWKMELAVTGSVTSDLRQTEHSQKRLISASLCFGISLMSLYPANSGSSAWTAMICRRRRR